MTNKIEKIRQVGRPRKSVEELTKIRDGIKAELDALRAERKATPHYKRSKKQGKRIVSLSSHLTKMNRRIVSGDWECAVLPHL